MFGCANVTWQINPESRDAGITAKMEGNIPGLDK
jgi:hypothetical protein